MKIIEILESMQKSQEDSIQLALKKLEKDINEYSVNLVDRPIDYIQAHEISNGKGNS